MGSARPSTSRHSGVQARRARRTRRGEREACDDDRGRGESVSTSKAPSAASTSAAAPSFKGKIKGGEAAGSKGILLRVRRWRLRAPPRRTRPQEAPRRRRCHREAAPRAKTVTKLVLRRDRGSPVVAQGTRARARSVHGREQDLSLHRAQSVLSPAARRVTAASARLVGGQHCVRSRLRAGAEVARPPTAAASSSPQERGVTRRFLGPSSLPPPLSACPLPGPDQASPCSLARSLAISTPAAWTPGRRRARAASPGPQAGADGA